MAGAVTRLRSGTWLAVALLLVTLPLLWPAVPPLNDMPGHIGRYHIAAELAGSAALQRHWDYHWAAIGNLGVDLPVMVLARMFGAELAAKLIVMTIPALTVLGLWLLARVRHIALPPLFGFACALAYGQAFQMGFVNFALSEALALIALAGWIALARRAVLRTIVFLPVACVLWLAHSSGWGLFGLCAWGTDVALRRERGGDWRHAVSGATLACLPLALPIVMMLGDGAGPVGVEWTLKAKPAAVAALMRDRWKWFDVASAILIVFVAWTALRHRAWRIDPVLGAAAALAFAAFLALPRLALGGAYVDMRMLAPALAILLVAARIDPPAVAARWLLAGGVFLVVRMVATTISFLFHAQTFEAATAAISHMPRGGSVLLLVNEPCTSQWHSDRLAHIGGIAVARRDVFENGQWAIAGQQLLRVKPPFDPAYHADPSQLVYRRGCEIRRTAQYRTELRPALAGFDRSIYTHVWLVGFADARVPADLRLRFRNSRSALYDVSSPGRR